jgi:adenosine deaminase
LNGSLSNKTLQMLHSLHSSTQGHAPIVDHNFYHILSSDSQDLSSCFQKFKYAHDLTSTKNSLKLATMAVIEDFADDNVMYLELRTTPKSNAEMSKMTYLKTVLEAIM